MTNKTIKIGDTEFELPFEADGRYIYDATLRFVAEANAQFSRRNGGDEQIAQTIAEALNEHFERKQEKENG